MSGLRVRTGIVVPSRPGVGSEAQQRRRLEHAAASHGLRPFDCPDCGGTGSRATWAGSDRGEAAGYVSVPCSSCGGYGLVFRAGNMQPCGPSCPLHEVKPV